MKGGKGEDERGGEGGGGEGETDMTAILNDSEYDSHRRGNREQWQLDMQIGDIFFFHVLVHRCMQMTSLVARRAMKRRSE